MNVVKGPTPQLSALTVEQITELHAVYAGLSALHHLTFDECLRDRSILICLWNVAQARAKTRARMRAAIQIFELTP